jgi:putative ABC transport system ATP-binding protein
LSSKANPSPNTPAISCKDIKKSYGVGVARVEALRGVDLVIDGGKLCLLMGPSGSGKTTLISIIAGILTQDSGECWINHTDINHLPSRERTRYRAKNIGFVFQIFNLIPMLNNEENISIPLILNGVDRHTAVKKARQLMEELGLGDKIGMYPADLSGGQQQRIAIARALIHDPALIVCDEPTSFLDHKTGHMIMQMLRDLVDERKITVIVVTHDPRIEGFADKIDHLEDGRIV